MFQRIPGRCPLVANLPYTAAVGLWPGFPPSIPFRLAAIALLVACSPAEDNAVPAETAAAVEPAPSATITADAALGSGVEQLYFDSSVRPGDDFYRYVNGVWLATTPIPADKSNYGSFTMLADEAQENLRTLIETAGAENAPVGSDSQKVGEFFRSFMDEGRVADLGAAPLQGELAQIVATDAKDALLVLSADLNRSGVQIPAGIYISNDEMQSDQYITYIAQSGLGLPDRDWYLSTDDATHEQARSAYRTYITNVMTLASYPRAAAAAESVLAIENRIAEAHWDRVRNRQAELTYNKRTLQELQAMAPAIDWATLLQGLGITETTFVVNQPSFIEALGAIWDEVPLQQWQDWFSFKLVDAYAPYLSPEFVDAQFDFEGRVLNGLIELEPRWKRGVNSVDSALGEVVGKLYVENYFQEEAKARMDELIENLRGAFRSGIDELEWMTAETRVAAQDKLARFNTKIGYPDKWKDYSALSVDASDLAGNVKRSRRLYRDENLELRITTDPHSHSEARANGVLRNIDAWYAAFSVQPGDALYLAPEERVKIW